MFFGTNLFFGPSFSCGNENVLVKNDPYISADRLETDLLTPWPYCAAMLYCAIDPPPPPSPSSNFNPSPFSCGRFLALLFLYKLYFSRLHCGRTPAVLLGVVATDVTMAELTSFGVEYQTVRLMIVASRSIEGGLRAGGGGGWLNMSGQVLFELMKESRQCTKLQLDECLLDAIRGRNKAKGLVHDSE